MEKFLEFVASVMDVDASEIDGETTYGDYEMWDSLMHMRLVMEIEEEYNIQIPIDDVPKIKTLSDFYEYIKK